MTTVSRKLFICIGMVIFVVAAFQPGWLEWAVTLIVNGKLHWLARVEPAGGKILQGKQDMGEPVGWIAFVEDTEGNRIGIQQQGEGKA